MPKAILEFDLPGEQAEYETTLNAANYFSALWDIVQKLRDVRKYSQDDVEANDAAKWEKIIWEILSDNDINAQF